MMNLRENISRRPCRFRRSSSRSLVRNVANLRLDMMVSRSGARMTETRSDVYGYNDRNELVSAGRDALVASAPEYEYSYDDIGNRLSSIEAGTGNREREASPILRPLRPLQRNSLPSTTLTATRRLCAPRPASGKSSTTARTAPLSGRAARPTSPWRSTVWGEGLNTLRQ